MFQRRCVEPIEQKLHVSFLLAGSHQEVVEAPDRHVGDREQPIEPDPEVFLQMPLVICLESVLGRR